MSEAQRISTAALRNREPIGDVLAEYLPASGTVLEIASGSGIHAVYMAERFPDLTWIPSDPDPDAIKSINAGRSHGTCPNLSEPVLFNTLDAVAPADTADAILCINMVHISPWEATEGLFAGAAQILSGKDLPLILYGPYFEQGIEPAPSNLQFDTGLRERNPRWGIRDAEKLDTLAHSHGFKRSARHEMPANNLILVYRRM